uniref:hypothetical protein n=1 Tax=Acetatifactor sp. TaxID=1872090 RepID=UPI004056DE4C
MERNDSKKRKSIFSEALQGKNIPVLTLDNKWYRLFDEVGKKEVKKLSGQLNNLLKRQGRLNTEIKEVKKLKKKLMNEIVPMVNQAEESGDSAMEKKIETHKRLIEECNEKLEKHQDELLELPREIEKVNFQLMLLTMECCYDTMQRNTDEIKEIEDWVTGIRIELKKRLIDKQEMEQRNHVIYSYMHDVFGAEVLDLFDMKYNPEKQHPTIPQEQNPN